MAPRPAWKGYLKLSLVTCAMELTNAVTHAEKVSFRILNRKTGNTVKRVYVDAETGKPIEDGDEIKGYEVGKDDFVHIEEDEIDAVQIESSHTMSLDGFVDKSSIEQIYLDTPYYVAPADKVSEEAFAVIRDAMAGKKKAGLARIVLYSRERPVVVEPLGKGMVLTTLRYDNTVRQPDTVFGDIESVKTDQEMIDLAEPHHRQEENEVRSLRIRRQIRGRPARTGPSQEGGPQGAESQGSAKTFQRRQPFRRAEEEPELGRGRQSRQSFLEGTGEKGKAKASSERRKSA